MSVLAYACSCMYMSVYWCVDVQSVCMPVNLSLSAYVLCVVCAIIVCTCMLCLCAVNLS